jgi:hypothetical protein
MNSTRSRRCWRISGGILGAESAWKKNHNHFIFGQYQPKKRNDNMNRKEEWVCLKFEIWNLKQSTVSICLTRVSLKRGESCTQHETKAALNNRRAIGWWFDAKWAIHRKAAEGDSDNKVIDNLRIHSNQSGFVKHRVVSHANNTEQQKRNKKWDTKQRENQCAIALFKLNSVQIWKTERIYMYTSLSLYI